MVKPMVQGQLGYWADGQLVYMPKRHQAKKAQPERAHVIRNKDRKMQLQQRRLYAQVYKKTSHLAFVLHGAIKNASKRGQVKHALAALAETTEELKRNTNIALSYFNVFCRLMFLPDIEERSAVYYASLTGHVQLLELYLSLYLMCSIDITESTQNASLTFREWFGKYGTRSMCLGKKFTPKDYDVCTLNALNDTTRYLLTKKKVTISQAMGYVVTNVDGKLSYWNSVAEDAIFGKKNDLQKKIETWKRIQRKKNAKAKKPTLVVEDLYQDYDDYDSEYDYDERYDEEDAYLDETTDSIQSDASEESNLDVHAQQLEDLEQLIASFQEDDLSIDFDDDSFSMCQSHVMIDGVPDDDDDDDDDEGGSLSNDWDIVSAVDNVKSIDSSMLAKPSYREMLMQPKKNVDEPTQPQVIPEEAEPSLSVPIELPNQTSDTNDDGIVDHDALHDTYDTLAFLEDERDGVKQARGGKASKMFNAEGKTQKQYGYGYHKYAPKSRNMKRSKMSGIPEGRSNNRYW